MELVAELLHAPTLLVLFIQNLSQCTYIDGIAQNHPNHTVEVYGKTSGLSEKWQTVCCCTEVTNKTLDSLEPGDELCKGAAKKDPHKTLLMLHYAVL